MKKNFIKHIGLRLPNKPFLVILILFLFNVTANSCLASGENISQLNRHFNKPDSDFSPWLFVPQDNIKKASTAEHPGLVTIWQAGKGKDVKGILKQPIKIGDYPVPWEFQLGLTQNYMAMLGVGSTPQMNYAIGLNLAVTYSDAAAWPKNRNERPPDTQEAQLLVVYLGATGEFAPGLPQYSQTPFPQTYLLYGRGDLDNSLVGDWKAQYVWDGSTQIFHGGPASHRLFFRFVLHSPTELEIGFKDEAKQHWRMRKIKCPKPITGIWEIGPVFSCDRWIPDVLCPSLPILKPGSEPKPLPPDPIFEYYVDYCTFFGRDPASWEYLSDEFNIRGYLANWQFQSPFEAETWSNPGYLTVTLLGPSQGMWFANTINAYAKLDYYKPPWEIETCFVAPDDSIPWNLTFTMGIKDLDGKYYCWRPGIQNFPKEKRHRYVNSSYTRSSFDMYYPIVNEYANYQSADTPFKLKFNPEIPEEILVHKPLYWLFQMIDSTHVRMAYKADPKDPWYFSEIYDCSEFTRGFTEFGCICWSTHTGSHFKAQPGSPMYEQLLFDYIRFRYGLSSK